jgi:hypothetical protein
MQKLVPVGRIFYVLPIVAFGAEHLTYGFVTRAFPYWPRAIPGNWKLWAWIIGLSMIAAGAAMAGRAYARVAALVLGTALLLSFFFLYLPLLMRAVNGGILTNGFKCLALAGGAFIVARTSPGGPWPSINGGLLSLGRLLFASFLIIAGALHFVYADFVAALVPGWIPGHLFWTYFAGVALIAGGIGMNVPKVARLAAFLTGVMIFTWVIVLHIPRYAGPPYHGNNVNELTAVFEALAFSGIAFMLAGLGRR